MRGAARSLFAATLLVIVGGLNIIYGIGALLSVGDSNPWWSLAIFFLCIWILHGILIYGEDERRAGV